MSMWEWLANVVSVILFAMLTYRLSQVVYSLPYRRRLLFDVQACAAQYRQEAEQQLDMMRDGKCELDSVRSKMGEFVAEHFDAGSTMVMMHRVIGLRLIKNDRSADARFADWFDGVSRDFARHYTLANLATEIGMLGTVAGGIFAFGHIGASDDPFAAFPSLALAMITTAAGLVIAIIVKLVLGQYAIWLNEVVSFTNRTIEDLVDLHEQTPPAVPPCHESFQGSMAT